MKYTVAGDSMETRGEEGDEQTEKEYELLCQPAGSNLPESEAPEKEEEEERGRCRPSVGQNTSSHQQKTTDFLKM